MAKLSEFNRAKYDQAEQIKKVFTNAQEQRRNLDGSMALSLCCLWIHNHKRLHRKGGGEKDRLALSALRIQTLLAEPDHFAQASRHNVDVTKSEGAYNQGGQLLKMAEKYDFVIKETKSIRDDNIMKFCNISHGYAILNLSRRSGPSTWVSTYKSSGKLFGIGSHFYAFDPNYGEFCVDTGQILQFVHALADEYVATRGFATAGSGVSKVGFK